MIATIHERERKKSCWFDEGSSTGIFHRLAVFSLLEKLSENDFDFYLHNLTQLWVVEGPVFRFRVNRPMFGCCEIKFDRFWAEFQRLSFSTKFPRWNQKTKINETLSGDKRQCVVVCIGQPHWSGKFPQYQYRSPEDACRLRQSNL